MIINFLSDFDLDLARNFQGALDADIDIGSFGVLP